MSDKLNKEGIEKVALALMVSIIKSSIREEIGGCEKRKEQFDIEKNIQALEKEITNDMTDDPILRDVGDAEKYCSLIKYACRKAYSQFLYEENI